MLSFEPILSAGLQSQMMLSCVESLFKLSCSKMIYNQFRLWLLWRLSVSSNLEKHLLCPDSITIRSLSLIAQDYCKAIFENWFSYSCWIIDTNVINAVDKKSVLFSYHQSSSDDVDSKRIKKLAKELLALERAYALLQAHVGSAVDAERDDMVIIWCNQ